MGKRSGSISTSDLIVELVDVLQPDGKDAQLLSGRNDSYFSQKVRNLKAHKTLEKLGFASVTADGWKFTSDGQMLYDRICQMLKPAFSAVTRENLKTPLILISSPPSGPSHSFFSQEFQERVRAELCGSWLVRAGNLQMMNTKLINLAILKWFR